jgi:phage minor structural protein, N-terminal region
MLKYLDKPLNCNYSITSEYGGAETLRLYISTHDERYRELKYENKVDADGNLYVIKSFDESNEECTIEAVLCQDDLKSILYAQFETAGKTLSETLTLALADTGWSHYDSGLKTIRRSISLADCTPLDIVEQCKETFGVAFEIDAVQKKLTTKLPESVQWNGLYITDQLNLRRVDYKGDSYEFVTRLYPYGVKDEAGNALTIASVNNGCEYVQNNDYSDKIIAAPWHDERFTDAQSLKDAAITKLQSLAKPLESYECDVIDISGAIRLYDKVMLLDRVRNTRTEFQCVELEEYPLTPEQDKVTLSSVVQTIEAKLSKKIESVSSDVKIVEAKSSDTALLARLMCGSLGLYKTVQKDNNGGSIYYMHDAATLEASKKIWKITADAFAVSSDGGQTWSAGVTAAGSAIVQTLIANKIVSPVDENIYIDLLNGDGSLKRIVGKDSENHIVYLNVGEIPGNTGIYKRGVLVSRILDGVERNIIAFSLAPFGAALTAFGYDSAGVASRMQFIFGAEDNTITARRWAAGAVDYTDVVSYMDGEWQFPGNVLAKSESGAEISMRDLATRVAALEAK